MALLKDAEVSRLLQAMEKSVNLMLEDQMKMRLAVAKEFKEINEKLDLILKWLPGIGNRV